MFLALLWPERGAEWDDNVQPNMRDRKLWIALHYTCVDRAYVTVYQRVDGERCQTSTYRSGRAPTHPNTENTTRMQKTTA